MREAPSACRVEADGRPPSSTLASTGVGASRSSVEVGPRIRVNGVAPGGTRTDLRGLAVLGHDDRSHFTDSGWEERMRVNNPLHMVLEPSDLAGAYVFLASSNARGITGTIVTVDAGSTLRMPRRS